MHDPDWRTPIVEFPRIRSHRDLLCWQRGMELAELTYSITRLLPSTERSGLCGQMQRAAVSIAANIAEGHGRMARGDYVRHLRIADGSLREWETHLELGERIHHLSSADVTRATRLGTELGGPVRV